MGMSNPFSIPMLLGSPGANDREYLGDIELAKTHDRIFILLRHYKLGNITEWIAGVDVAKIFKRENQRTKTTDISVVNQTGHLGFIPNPSTGIKYAFLLDTEYNRRFLASHFLEDRWSIEDALIREEIKKAAKKLVIVVDTSQNKATLSFQTPVDPAALLKSMSPEQLEIEADKKKKELEAIESIQSKPAPVIEKTISSPDQKETSKEARKIVHEQFADEIAKMKKKSPRGYVKLKVYQDKIQPHVDKLIMQGAAEPATPGINTPSTAVKRVTQELTT